MRVSRRGEKGGSLGFGLIIGYQFTLLVKSSQNESLKGARGYEACISQKVVIRKIKRATYPKNYTLFSKE
jgi:hypothetical protein